MRPSWRSKIQIDLHEVSSCNVQNHVDLAGITRLGELFGEVIFAMVGDKTRSQFGYLMGAFC
jgi:hypothetical protein